MSTNRNQLREEAVELAVLIGKICGSMKDGGSYAEQMLHSVTTIGSALSSLKNLRDELSIVRRMNIALDACAEVMFLAKVLLVEEKLSEENYKLLKKSVAQIERRISSSLVD